MIASLLAFALPVLSGATPSPVPSPDLDPIDVTPGVGGFLATFAVVLVTILLMLDMTRRIRRLRLRQRREQEELRAAQAARGAQQDGDDSTS